MELKRLLLETNSQKILKKITNNQVGEKTEQISKTQYLEQSTETPTIKNNENIE